MNENKQPMKQSDHPLHRVFRNFWGDDIDFFQEGWPSLRRLEKESNLSLSEDDKSVYVEAALPGLSDNEIEVTLERGVLWIRGQKKQQEDNKKYHYRAKSSYSYHIALPDSVDENQEPTAKYDQGILHITFYKNRGSSAKKINIKRS